MQLQGETLNKNLKTGAEASGKVLDSINNNFDHSNNHLFLLLKNQIYKNSLDCLIKTFKYEGVRGLQKGLTPAVFREGSKNIFRLVYKHFFFTSTKRLLL